MNCTGLVVLRGQYCGLYCPDRKWLLNQGSSGVRVILAENRVAVILL